MLPWRMVVVGLFYCCIRTGVAQCQSKAGAAEQSVSLYLQALFPAASRVKRGVPNAGNLSFHNSFDDVHLLFEILLTGVHFDTNGEFYIKDAELASLRKTQNLEVICEEVIPRKLTDIFTLISGLSNCIGHLQQDDFERTLLTLVYIAHQMVSATTGHQRDVWAESFVSIYKAVKQDLIGTK
ncbi:hypothetical protein INR49_005195 [Caranx melampygus]|nr:hypothetical protein INR49_005195 [Caranx melampygus]